MFTIMKVLESSTRIYYFHFLYQQLGTEWSPVNVRFSSWEAARVGIVYEMHSPYGGEDDDASRLGCNFV
jgi:hypothetical protein